MKKIKTLKIVIKILFIFVISILFCFNNFSFSFADKNIKLLEKFSSIGTGSVAGTYFPVGVGLARLINSNINDEAAIAIPTDGSLDNIYLIDRGDLKYGFCQSDIFYYAVRGKNMFDGTPHKNLRIVISLYPEVVQILVRSGSDIWEISDLRGKKVCLGKKLSGTKVNSEMILKYHDISISDIVPYYYGFSQSIEELIEGKIDVTFITAGIPTEAIVNLMKNSSLRLVSMDKKKIEKICKKFPYFTKYTIKANTYDGQSIKIDTIATRALIVTDKKSDSSSIWKFLNMISRKILSLRKIHPVLKDFDLESGKNGMIPGYIHKESMKFFHIKLPEKK